MHHSTTSSAVALLACLVLVGWTGGRFDDGVAALPVPQVHMPGLDFDMCTVMPESCQSISTNAPQTNRRGKRPRPTYHPYSLMVVHDGNAQLGLNLNAPHLLEDDSSKNPPPEGTPNPPPKEGGEEITELNGTPVDDLEADVEGGEVKPPVEAEALADDGIKRDGKDIKSSGDTNEGKPGDGSEEEEEEEEEDDGDEEKDERDPKHKPGDEDDDKDHDHDEDDDKDHDEDDDKDHDEDDDNDDDGEEDDGENDENDDGENGEKDDKENGKNGGKPKGK